MTHKLKKVFVSNQGRSYDLVEETDSNLILKRSIWLIPFEPPLWCFQYHEVCRTRNGWFKHVNFPSLAIEMVLSGGMYFQEPARSVCIHKGEIFIIPPGSTVKGSLESNTNLRTVTLLFSGSQLRNFSGELGFLTGTVIRPRDPKIIEKKIRDIGALLERKNESQRNKISCLCYELLLLLSEDSVREQPTDKIHKVISSFLADPSTPETAASLAQKAGCSESTLRKQFSLLFSRTPGAWICEQKMNHSIKLLRKNSILIKEVAAACGFDNPQSFSHVFKRYFGTTPVAYRREFESLALMENTPN